MNGRSTKGGTIMNLKNFLPARRTGNHGLVRASDDVPLVAFHHDMNRLFDDFFRDFERMPSAWALVSAETRMPRVDVSETETEIRIAADLPGMDEKDIDVSLTEGVLTIRGETKFEKDEKEENFHRVERSYGTFQRSIPLPAEVEEDKADAVFSMGVLRVTLPKAKEVRNQKKITVKRAD
jgi:HSP20 family protein